MRPRDRDRHRAGALLAARAAAAVAVVAACTAGPAGPGIDVDRALGHVAALVALGPRPSDSPAAARAVDYVEAQLAALGLVAERVPVGEVTLPEMVILGARLRGEHRETTHDPDLVVRLGPPGGRALLVMAHYDTVPGSPGAVDNAAAVGVVLELARALVAAPPRQPVMLTFTAAEERGLVGAEALAAQRGREVGFAVALDLIGAHGELTLNGASRLIGDAELGWLARAADRAGVVVRAPLPHRVISRAWPTAERADHGAFTRRGVPAVHFYHRGQDGEWIDLAYHSPRDTAARVDPRAVDEIGRLLRALTAEPPPAHAGDGLWLPVVANVVVPRWPLVALDVGLGAIALGLLVGMRRARARGGLGVLAALGCGAAALAATTGIERWLAGDHPAAWLHAPGQAVLGELAVFAGALVLATRVAHRFAPWVGDRRYVAIAVVMPLAIGLGWMLFGAAELAWIWLLPAACAAASPRLGRAGIVAALPACLPGVLLLLPNQVREAAWNGFWPLSLPLAVWVAALGLAPAALVAGWVRGRRRPLGPLGTAVLPVGATLAIAAGVWALARAPLPCNPQQFREFQLACEVSPRVY